MSTGLLMAIDWMNCSKEYLKEQLASGENPMNHIGELREAAEIRNFARRQVAAVKGNDEPRWVAEVVLRLAERRVGQLVREGQDRGEIGHQRANSSSGRNLPSSMAYFDHAHDREDSYVMADVSDKAFAKALVECIDSGNTARASVLRALNVSKSKKPPTKDKWTATQRRNALMELAKAYLTSEQIARELGVGAEWVRREARRLGIEIPADVAVGKTNRFDSNRIAGQIVSELEGLAYSVSLIEDELADLASASTPHWLESLNQSLRTVNRFHRKLKEVSSANEDRTTSGAYGEGGPLGASDVGSHPADACVADGAT